MKNLPYYENTFIVFTFQGENLPDNPWFLEMDISKDFNSADVMSRQDYLNFVRVKSHYLGNEHGLQMEKSHENHARRDQRVDAYHEKLLLA